MPDIWDIATEEAREEKDVFDKAFETEQPKRMLGEKSRIVPHRMSTGGYTEVSQEGFTFVPDVEKVELVSGGRRIPKFRKYVGEGRPEPPEKKELKFRPDVLPATPSQKTRTPTGLRGFEGPRFVENVIPGKPERENIFRPGPEAVERKARELGKSAAELPDFFTGLLNLAPGVNIEPIAPKILQEEEDPRSGLQKFVEGAALDVAVTGGASAAGKAAFKAGLKEAVKAGMKRETAAAIERQLSTFQTVRKAFKRPEPMLEFGKPVDELTPADNLIKMLNDDRTKIVSNWSDDLEALRLSEEVFGLNTGNVLDNAFELAKHNRGTPGLIQSELEQVLFPVVEKIPKGKLDDFREYLISKTGLNRLARKPDASLGETADGIKRTKEYMEGIVSKFEADPLFHQMQKRVNGMSRLGLSRLYESGVIDKDTLLRELRANPDHVPIYRILPETAGKSTRKGFGKGGQKEFVGSELPIDDPIVNVARQHEVYTRLAKKNEVARRVLDMVERNEESISPLIKVKAPGKPKKQFGSDALEDSIVSGKVDIKATNPVEDVLIDIFKPAQGLAKNQRPVWKNGKMKILEFSKDAEPLLEAFDAAVGFSGSISDGIVGRVLAYSTVLLKKGATSLNPEFIFLRNPPRDIQIRAIQTSGRFRDAINPRPYLNAFKEGFVNSIPGVKQETKEAFAKNLRKFHREGGGFSTFSGSTRANTIREIDKITGEKGHMARKAVDSLVNIASIMESIPRLTEYQSVLKQLLRQGVPYREAKARALRASQEVTLNFSTIGKKMRSVNKVVPFANPGVRDLSKIKEMWVNHPGRTAARTAMTVTIPSTILYLVNKDDEKYQALPEMRKNMFLHLPKEKFVKSLINSYFPDGDIPEEYQAFFNKILEDVEANPYMEFPRPFGHGFIGGRNNELVLDHFWQNDPEAFANWKEAIMQSLAPAGLGEVGLSGNPLYLLEALPLVSMLSVLQGEYGYDPFQKRQVLTLTEAGLPKASQRDAYTSPTLAYVAEKLRGTTAEFSPKRVQTAIYKQFAGLSKIGFQGIDFVFRNMVDAGLFGEDGVAKAIIEEIPKRRVGRSFIDQSLVERFFELSKKGQKVATDIKRAEDRGSPLLKRLVETQIESVALDEILNKGGKLSPKATITEMLKEFRQRRIAKDPNVRDDELAFNRAMRGILADTMKAVEGMKEEQE